MNALVDLAVAGRAMTEVYEGERRFSIALHHTKAERSSVDAIAALQILTPGGGSTAGRTRNARRRAGVVRTVTLAPRS